MGFCLLPVNIAGLKMSNSFKYGREPKKDDKTFPELMESFISNR